LKKSGAQNTRAVSIVLTQKDLAKKLTVLVVKNKLPCYNP
jgi:hypothetical protein